MRVDTRGELARLTWGVLEYTGNLGAGSGFSVGAWFCYFMLIMG